MDWDSPSVCNPVGARTAAIKLDATAENTPVCSPRELSPKSRVKGRGEILTKTEVMSTVSAKLLQKVMVVLFGSAFALIVELGAGAPCNSRGWEKAVASYKLKRRIVVSN